MKKILLFTILLSGFLIAQQINHTWGYTTAGVAYNQTGSANTDSIDTIDIVFDLQDYYYLDWYPLTVNDILTISGDGPDTVGVDTLSGTTTATVYSNSTRLYYGTFWYRIDMENAADTSKILIRAYPGNMVYFPSDDSRITTTNINFSTTATTLLADTSSYTANDRQWTSLNVYINETAGKVLPPEFIKLNIDFVGTTNDSIDVYWDFAYPAVYQYYQDLRSNNITRKAAETLH
jgi:hypothetical protein